MSCDNNGKTPPQAACPTLQDNCAADTLRTWLAHQTDARSAVQQFLSTNPEATSLLLNVLPRGAQWAQGVRSVINSTDFRNPPPGFAAALKGAYERMPYRQNRQCSHEICGMRRGVSTMMNCGEKQARRYSARYRMATLSDSGCCESIIQPMGDVY